MKIWTYGCSFTSGVEEFFWSEKAWPNLLDIDIEYQSINRGHAGGGFHDVREHVLEDLGKITQKDLVIVQLPFSNRVVIPYFVEEWDSYMRILHRKNKLPDNEGWLKYLKEREELDKTLEQEASILFDALERLDINFLWWSATLQSDDWRQRYSQRELFIDGTSSSYVEWIKKHVEFWYNIEHRDWHQNEKGHREMARVFSTKIRQYIQKDQKEKTKLF